MPSSEPIYSNPNRTFKVNENSGEVFEVRGGEVSKVVEQDSLSYQLPLLAYHFSLNYMLPTHALFTMFIYTVLHSHL